ncbi:MAG: flagellar basal-body rod protein FlgF [Caulobacterales bacterium]
MDNAIYVGLSRQITLQRELDIAANNVANTDTAGFKLEDLLTAADPAAPAKTTGVNGPVTFVVADGVSRDFRQGALRQTGEPLDFAIDGQGFFIVSTASGPRYTRDGRFKLDPQGKLTTQDGDAVQGSGGDIVLDPNKGQVSVSATGVISQGIGTTSQVVGQLSVVTFDDLSALQKDGNNLFENTSNLTAHTASNALIKQGMLEGSNVNALLQMTRLVAVSRAYDAVSNMMNSTADLSTRTIQRLGAPTP